MMRRLTGALRRLTCLHVYAWPAEWRYFYGVPGCNRQYETRCGLCGKRKVFYAPQTPVWGGGWRFDSDHNEGRQRGAFLVGYSDLVDFHLLPPTDGARPANRRGSGHSHPTPTYRDLLTEEPEIPCPTLFPVPSPPPTT